MRIHSIVQPILRLVRRLVHRSVPRVVRDAAAFLTLGVLVAGVLFQVSERVDPAYAEVKERMDMLRQRADEIKVIAAGHSHTMDVAFDTMDVEGFYLWRPSEDVFETNYRMRHAAEVLPNLEVVLIAASYWIFRRDNSVEAAELAAYFKERRRELYATVPPVSVRHAFIPGDLTSFVTGKLTPLVRKDHYKGIVRSMLAGRTRHAEVGPYGRLGEQSTVMTQAKIRNGVDDIIAHEMHLQQTMTRYHDGLVEDAYGMVRDMVERLGEEGVQVLFFTPPYPPIYTRRFDAATITEMKRLMRTIASDFPNAHYLDHSSDRRFITRPELYRDVTHLNMRGARLYSAQVLEPEVRTLMSSGRPSGTEAHLRQ